MEKVSQLILRNAERLGDGKILLINPPRDNCFSQLAEPDRTIRLFTQDFGDFTWHRKSGAEAAFGIIPEPDSCIERLILIQPRERERLLMLLHALSSSMATGAKLWLIGENRSGIKSCGKRLSLYFENTAKTDSARHCTLLEASKPIRSEPFDLAAYEKTWTIGGNQGVLSLTSLPGTFAHGGLDKGSELLLGELTEIRPSGRILDFACGNGVIGLYLLSLDSGIDLTMLDTSALALESARLSLCRNGGEAKLVASDGLSELSGQFDWIISNPPFHRGVENHLGVARVFLERAGHFLSKTGRILLVCNHHLPYPAWLKKCFNAVEILKANRSFKVIQASGFRG